VQTEPLFLRPANSFYLRGRQWGRFAWAIMPFIGIERPTVPAKCYSAEIIGMLWAV